jgi:hypothetical protein
MTFMGHRAITLIAATLMISGCEVSDENSPGIEREEEVSAVAVDPAHSRDATPAYGVDGYQKYLPEYQGRYAVALRDIYDSSDPLPVKEARWSAALAEMQQSFAQRRRAEYTPVSRDVRRSGSCTKGNSGGPTKVCGPYCIRPPANFHSRDNIVAYKTRPGGPVQRYVSAPEGRACFRLRKSGKGRVVGYLEETYHLSPTYIASTVASETEGLFSVIAERIGSGSSKP